MLGVSGSIAAYKAVEIARRLGKDGVEVQVAMTASATQFVAPLTFESITGRPVLDDPWSRRGGRIEHVEHAHEIDLLVIAPATAHTLARLALGLADDVLSAVALSTQAPILVAPAMEHGMWNHPATQANFRTLLGRGVHSVGPVQGALASGRVGDGRMSEPEAVVRVALAVLGTQDLVGESVLITAGTTWEPIDPVRFLGNRSTGAMGIALAEAAAKRGAEVRLVLGPTALEPKPLPAITVVRVETARQMLDASLEGIESRTVVVGAAAVSDFRPAVAHAQKLKRTAPGARTICLEENPDVIASLSAQLQNRGSGGIAVGFAAETEDVIENALIKLDRKKLDLVIGNAVGPKEGFGPGATAVIAVAKDKPPTPFGPADKSVVAQFIWDQVVEIRGAKPWMARG